MVIAIDFDNTLSLDNYPTTGLPTGGHLVVKLLQEKGHECFLYTCRKGIPLNNALMWCANHGIPMQSISSPTWEHTGKEYFDLCIDDRNLGVPLIQAPYVTYVDWCGVIGQLLCADIITAQEYHTLYSEIRECQYNIFKKKDL